MNAAEAREKATVIAKNREKETKEKNYKAKVTKILKHIDDNKKFITMLETSLREDIEYAVSQGKTSIKRTLSEDNRDLMITWFEGDEYSLRQYMDGQHKFRYLEKARFGKEIQTVLLRFKRKGFKVEVSYESVEHDESLAYANSGGECGRKEPWWTSNNVLKISW